MKFLFIIYCFFFTCFLSAQTFTIQGNVIDYNQQPISNIQVNLVQNDSIIVKQSFTNDFGFFSINIEKGVYKLFLRFYNEDHFVNEIFINEDIDLGKLEIESEETLLEDIIIAGKKKMIERKVDRLVFNVGESIYATGGNVMDALKITPRLKVQNDQISMIGKGNIKVMINDKIVMLSGDDLFDYLKSFKNEDIERIEVISNPPSKYGAEGNSGLVNIVTKQVVKNTWNTSLRGSYTKATYATSSIGSSFDVKRKELQITTSISYNNGSNASVETNKVYYPSFNWYEYNNRRDYRNSLSTRIGLKYQINKNLTTGIDYSFSNNKPMTKNNNYAEIYNSTSVSLDSIIKSPARSEFDRTTHIANYYLVYKLDSIGKKISLDVDFFNFNSETRRKYITQRFFVDGQPTSKTNTISENFGIQGIDNFSINLDMEHPISWAHINYGGKTSYIKTTNFFNSNEYVDDINLLDTNLFNYTERTSSLYFSIQKEFSKKWQGKIGLRLENSLTEGKSETLNQTTKNNYTKLFPTIYLVHTLDDNNSFSLNYGKRISRPNYEFLNPFVIMFSKYSYAEGNPFLRPAFVNNFEFEYNYKNKWTAVLYYSLSNDLFGQVTFLNSTTNVQRIFPENYITNKVFGFYQGFNFKPTNFLNISTSSNISYNLSNSKIPDILNELKGWSTSFDVSTDLTLNTKSNLFLNLYYYHVFAGVSNLHQNSSYNQTDISLKCLLIEKKLTLSLQARDIFSSNRPSYLTYSNNIKNTFKNYYDQRSVRFSIIYSFGKELPINKRNRLNEDELNRI